MATKALRDLSISMAKKPGGGADTSMSTPGSGAGTGNFRTLGNPNQGLNDSVNNALGSFVGSNDLGKQEKTIMETFAARAGLAKEGGIADRKLTDSNFAGKIAGQLDANASEYTQASEGRAGFGTQTAAVRMLEDSGGKRVRDLEKQRDELLLQSKVMEAGRLDNLIADEQSAITTARKTWIDNLLMTTAEARAQSAEARDISVENRNISREERDIAAFETPEQARTRDLVANLAGDSIKSIQALATTAPGAGITSTDTFDQAVAKYRNSVEYKQNVRKGELEIQQAEASIANTRSITNDRNNPTSSAGLGGAGVTSDGVYSSDLEFAIDAGAGTIGSLFGQKQYYDRVKKARNDSDKISIIASAILANSPADVKLKFNNDTTALSNIDQAIAMLDSGLQSGALNASIQYAYNIVGKDFDPKLSQIQQFMTAALQPYRSNITGAAWGQKETKEYEALFGSTKYSPTELKQRLVGLKSIMLNKTSSALNAQINPLGNMPNLMQSSQGSTTSPFTTVKSNYNFIGI